MRIAIIPQEEIDIIIPLLQVLNPNIDTETLRGRLQEMSSQNYICVGVWAGDKLIAISGLWIMTKYYVGKHIEPDNVIVLPDYRSQGVGKKLMHWIYDYGKAQGCVASELNCYIGNEAAHKFWQEEGYAPIALHFQKML